MCPNISVRCDNNTAGIIQQYVINEGHPLNETNNNLCNPYASMSWDKDMNPYYTLPELDGISKKLYRLGGRSDDNPQTTDGYKIESNFIHLLKIKMPKEPQKNAKIKNVFLKTRGYFETNNGLEQGDTVWLYKLNENINFDVSSLDYITNSNCAIAYCNNNSQYVYGYDTSSTGNGSYFNGIYYKRDVIYYPVVIYPYTQNIGQDQTNYFFFACDERPDGFIFGVHPKTYNAFITTKTTVSFYIAKASGQGYTWSKLDVLFNETDDSTHSSFYYSGRIFFEDTSLGVQVPSANIKSLIETTTGKSFMPGTPSPPNNKYWFYIKSITNYDTPTSSLVVLEHIRPAFIGAPCANMPRLIPAYGYYWNIDPEDDSTDKNDAYSPKSKFTEGDGKFGSVDYTTLDKQDITNYLSRIVFNLNALELDWEEEACLLMRAQSRVNSPTLYRTLGTYGEYSDDCFLEIEYYYEEGDKAVSKLEIEPYENDKRYMKIKWDKIENTDNLSAIVIQARAYGYTDWEDIATFTDFGITEYILRDNTIDIGGGKTCLSNNLHIEVRLKLKYSTTGFADGYTPYITSGIVSAYRPGGHSTYPFEITSTPLTTNTVLTFSCKSATCPSGHYIKKRYIYWVDGSNNIEEFVLSISQDNSSDITHIFKESDLYVLESYVIWETEKGFQSFPVYCSSKLHSAYAKTEASLPINITSVNNTNLYPNDNIIIDFSQSRPNNSNTTISKYKYLCDTDITKELSETTSLIVEKTVGNTAPYVLSIACSSDDKIGTGFDGVCGYTFGSSEISYLYNQSELRIKLGESIRLTIGAYKPLYLFSKTPIRGLVLNMIDDIPLEPHPVYSFWDGSTFAEYQDTVNPLAPWNANNKYHAIYFPNPIQGPMTAKQREDLYLNIYDTETPMYCLRISWEIDEVYPTLRMALLNSDNFKTLTMISSEIIILNELNNFYINNINLTIPRDLRKYMLANGSKTYIHDNGFGGYEISIDAVIKGEEGLSSGNILSASNLSTKDYLVYLMKQGIYTQIDYERDRDKYRGKISRVAFKKNAGAYLDCGVSMDMLVDSVLYYYEEARNRTVHTQSSMRVYRIVVEEDYTYFYTLGSLSVGDFFIFDTQEQGMSSILGLYQVLSISLNGIEYTIKAKSMPEAELGEYLAEDMTIYPCIIYATPSENPASKTTFGNASATTDFEMKAVSKEDECIYEIIEYDTITKKIYAKVKNIYSKNRHQTTISNFCPSTVKLCYYIERGI